MKSQHNSNIIGLSLSQIQMLNTDHTCRCMDKYNHPVFTSWSGTTQDFCYESCCEIYHSGSHGSFGNISFTCPTKNLPTSGDQASAASGKKGLFGRCQ